MPNSPLSKALVTLVAACFWPAVGQAQASGLGSQQVVIPAFAFAPTASGYQFAGGTGITPTAAGSQTWVASLGVPTGAQIDEIDVLVVDNDATLDIDAFADLAAFPVSGSGSCGGYFATASSYGITGQGTVVMSDPYGPYPLNNEGVCNAVNSYLTYYISVTLQSTSHSLEGARVAWHRVVSPAPGAADFGDVPTSSPYFQFVEALYHSGITAGCGGGNYCPTNPVTRGQLAVYLAKALGLNWPN
jgi:S-layer homology domain